MVIQAPPQRCYSEKIVHVQAPPRPQNTYIQAPSTPAPHVTILNMPEPKKECCVEPCCLPSYDRVELTDDEEEEAPAPVPEQFLGVEQDEFDLLK